MGDAVVLQGKVKEDTCLLPDGYLLCIYFLPRDILRGRLTGSRKTATQAVFSQWKRCLAGIFSISDFNLILVD
jgi:hypothetical protein